MREEYSKIDIEENSIINIDPIILAILLIDRTSNKNIIWATDNYKEYGTQYDEDKTIQIELITGENGNIIKPRIEKSKKEQYNRSREKGEVFTPSWMCNIQNNLIDEKWFGYKNVFNKEYNSYWMVNEEKIEFPKNKKWEDYIKDKRLEVSCGEAPYIVSRYDTVTGNIIPIKSRIGLLDRKLRIINENTQNKEEWLKWAEVAYKSIYGYDWQGDNILLARENLLVTLIDYYEERFNEKLDRNKIMLFAEIISWNIWQMDGLKGVIPNSCQNEEENQLSLFIKKKKTSKKCIGCESENIHNHNGIYCKIMDWDKNKAVKFVNLIK